MQNIEFVKGKEIRMEEIGNKIRDIFVKIESILKDKDKKDRDKKKGDLI